MIPHKFLAILYVSDRSNFEYDIRLHRTKREAKEWVEKQAIRRGQAHDKYQEKFNRVARRAEKLPRPKRMEALRRIMKESVGWVECAEVYEMFTSGSVKLRAAFDGTANSDKDGRWKGWR